MHSCLCAIRSDATFSLLASSVGCRWSYNDGFEWKEWKMECVYENEPFGQQSLILTTSIDGCSIMTKADHGYAVMTLPPFLSFCIYLFLFYGVHFHKKQWVAVMPLWHGGLFLLSAEPHNTHTHTQISSYSAILFLLISFIMSMSSI